ncbi:hypothetical protein ACLGCM_07565 [Helicobacter pylori]
MLRKSPCFHKIPILPNLKIPILPNLKIPILPNLLDKTCLS